MMEESIKILLVEDEPAYAELLRQHLKVLTAPKVRPTHVSSLNQAEHSLREEHFDLALLDLNLPDSEGLNTYNRFNAAAQRLPIVVITGIGDDELALAAMREGAQDYLLKNEFDAKSLHRAIRYTLERKRAEEALRRSEKFFRFIAENVSDLIAVIDSEGRRIYNSPSYKKLLGDPELLVGTNCFEEIHPADRDRIIEIFHNTLATRTGARAEYRMILKDGSVRFIESQSNIIENDSGSPQVVLVSRDITERKASSELLREALSDLKKSHEALKATQIQLVQSERLEAVNTFAAGVAHEVKNPLQTIILGVDFLANRLRTNDSTAKMVLSDMGNAVQRADTIIRGLMEFSGQSKRQVRQENLTEILEHALSAIQPELANYPVNLHKELAEDLPLLELDHKSMKHVFINLLLQVVRNTPRDGGQIRLRTYARELTEPLVVNGKSLRHFKSGDTVVCAQLDERPNSPPERHRSSDAAAANPQNAFGITVLKKIVELYGGVIDVSQTNGAGGLYRIFFKSRTQAYAPQENPGH